MRPVPPTIDNIGQRVQIAPSDLAALIATATRPEAGVAEADSASSRIVLLRLTRDICRTLLTAADIRLGMRQSAAAIARTIQASAVSIRVLVEGKSPLEATAADGSETPFDESVSIHDGTETIGTLSVGGLNQPGPSWRTSDVLPAFLEGVADEIANCVTHLRTRKNGGRPANAPTVDADSVGMVTLDPHQRVSHWGRGARRILGWPPEDIVGRDFGVAVREHDRPRFQAMLAEALQGRRPAVIAVVARRWDRTELPIGIEAVPIIGETGVERVSLIVHDQSRTDQLRRLVESLSAAAGVLDGCATLDAVGDAWLRDVCKAMRWSRGELWLASSPAPVQFSTGPNIPGNWERKSVWTAADVNCETLDAVEAVRRENGEHDLLTAVRGRRTVVQITDLMAHSTGPHAVAAWKCGLHDAVAIPVVIGGETAGAVLFLHSAIPTVDDVTAGGLLAVVSQLATFLRNERLQDELRRSELNALQSQKMEAMGRLAGGIVHDFNNLLTIILALSEIITDTLDEAAPQREMIAEIERTSHRAAALTQQLLAFSRKQPLQSAILNVNGRLDDLKSMLRRLLDERITLEFGTTRTAHRVKFDPIQFEQVLLNLVVNARDAIAGTGSIVVSLRDEAISVAAARMRPGVRPGQFVVVSVKDSGCGMDEKTRARILEPFFTTKAQGKGTGMGLATVNETVEQAGGFLTIESEPGVGTTIDVFLPQTNDLPETMQADHIPADQQRGNETVLLVEAEDVLRSLTARMLEVRGYHVLQAADATQALAMLKKQRGKVDLLISDLTPTGMSGRDLASRARAIGKGLRVLFVSSDLSAETSQAESLSNGRPLCKPFTSSALGSEVRRILDASGSIDD